MDTQIVKLEHLGTKTSNTYGGTTTKAEYNLKTICNGVKNEYEITAEIRGIATADLHLNMIDCKPLTNNEETLIKEAIEELLNW
jgi:hypothetical protein